jgi:hypothetical protein
MTRGSVIKGLKLSKFHLWNRVYIKLRKKIPIFWFFGFHLVKGKVSL